MQIAKVVARGVLRPAVRSLRRAKTRFVNRGKTPVQRAIGWFHANLGPTGGVLPFPANDVATPEVTGYSIPTLYNWGEKDLARSLARWEASVQHPSGAVCAIDGVPYTFDTAQAIRGFLAVVDDMPELQENLRRACDYVERQIAPDGEVRHESYDTWICEGGEMLSEYGNLYCLPPMLRAGEKLNEPRYIAAARRGMEYFRRKPDLMEFKPDMSMISHYLGYMCEALADLGEPQLAREGLHQAAAVQRPDGAIPAYPGVEWVCSTGMAQLSIAWYKIGEPAPADRAMDYLTKLQNPSGGFFGSYGKGARYFPHQEIAWATKFFLDAWMLRGQTENGTLALDTRTTSRTTERATHALNA